MTESAESLEIQLAEAKRQLASLQQTHAGDHRGFVESRRSICEQSDQYKARAEAAEARLEAVKALEDELFMALLAAGQSAWPDVMPSLVSYARELSIKLHAALSVAPNEAP